MVHKLLNTGQLDTVVLLIVASQMMRGQAPPQIFFLEPPLRSIAISYSMFTGLFFYCTHFGSPRVGLDWFGLRLGTRNQKLKNTLQRQFFLLLWQFTALQ